MWAVGGAPPANPQPTLSGVGLIFHRVNGVWQVATALNSIHSSTELDPYGIYMTSSTSGWIVGGAHQSKQSSEGYTTVSHALLLRYDGHRWTQVTAPLGTVTENDSLQQIVGTGPNDIWASGRSSADAVTSTGLQISSLLLHYDGASWSQVTPSISVTGGNLAMILSIDCRPRWRHCGQSADCANYPNSQVLPMPLFWFYRNGAWSVAPATRGK